MDYPSIFDDPDQSTEGSPWGAPNPIQQQQQQEGEQDREREHEHQHEHGQEGEHEPGQPSGDHGHDASEPPSVAPEQSPATPAQQHHAPTPNPARHSAPSSRHKLQAKITGLERIGKKDLILRFDVQVCCPLLFFSLIFSDRY